MRLCQQKGYARQARCRIIRLSLGALPRAYIYPNLPRLKRILVGLHAEPQGLALGFVFRTLHSPSVPLLMYEVLKYLDLRVHFKSRGPPAWGPSVENRRFRYHCSLVLGDTAYPNVLCMENEMIMLGANSFHA